MGVQYPRIPIYENPRIYIYTHSIHIVVGYGWFKATFPMQSTHPCYIHMVRPPQHFVDAWT